MSNYSRPGVFVNQSLTPLTSSPSGVTGGAVACFVGAYNRGPTTPTQVTSWQNFVNLYGGFSSAGSPLAYAVWQYFANGGSACFVYRVPNTDAVVANTVIGSIEVSQATLTAPAAPSPTEVGTGGTVAAGVYQVEVAYVDADGETTPSAAGSVTTSGSTSIITIPSPAAQSGATGWYAYVTQAGGSTFVQQQTAGSPTAIGQALTISAPPTSSGTAPPTVNTSGSNAPANAGLLTFTANSPGAWANGLYVEVVPQGSGSDSSATFTLNVYQGGTGPVNLVETWLSVSLNPASTRNLVNLVNATGRGSNYITATVNFGDNGYRTDGSCDPAGNSGSPQALGNGGSDTAGADGSTAPSLDTAITNGITGAGSTWSSPGLSSITSVVLNINLPASQDAGIDTGVLNNIITWAETQGNVFVVIDAPFGGYSPLKSGSALVTSYQDYVNGSTVLNASAQAAVYGPWLSVQDPASSTANATVWVAPGGAVLGQWAVNDQTHNVAQTPAGTQATVNAIALEAAFSATDLNNLETLQVNPIKQIPGAGLCVFGGRTLAIGYPNRYINVSRTLMQFTLDFVNITQFAIFQNNDAALWQSITNVLTGYLTQAMQANMLASTSPESAFSVVCDGSTTSSAQAQAGIVNAQVAVALVSPAEFIIINLSQMQGGGTATVSS